MVRVYEKKAKTYTEENLALALKDIKCKKLSIRAASKQYNIDKSLLSRKILQTHCGKQGRQTSLTRAQETELASHLKTLAKWGFALSKVEVLGVVGDFVSQNEIKTQFKNGLPGIDWYRSFAKRNRLSLKGLEPLDVNRRKATQDPFIIFGFYDVLDNCFATFDYANHPEHIWNLDETGFCSDPSRIKGVTGIGQVAHRVIQGSGKDNTSVLACCNAAGKLLPPLIIYSATNLWTTWKGTNDLPGTSYACTEKGYMTTVVFQEFFNKFCGVVKERPLLLIFDGHLSHIDTVTITKAMEENITIVKLPSHTTDVLQPLDKTCFRPMKVQWDKNLIEWQRQNQRTLTKSEFVNLLCQTWHKGITVSSIQAGFLSTGIFPLDRKRYPSYRLNPTLLEKYNVYKENGQTLVENNVEENMPDDEDLQQEIPSSEDTTSPVRPTQDLQSEISTLEYPIASTSGAVTPTSFEDILLKKIGRTPSLQKPRRKIDMNAKVITTEEFLISIEERNAKKTKVKKIVAKPPKSKIKGQSKKPQKKKVLVDIDETDDDSSWVPSGDSLDDFEVELSDEEEQNPHEVEIIDEEEENLQTTPPANTETMLAVDDFILVRFASKKTIYRYLCVVQEIMNDDEASVMAFRMVGDRKTFRAEENDTATINHYDIIKKLSSPEVELSGARIKYKFKDEVDVYEKP